MPSQDARTEETCPGCGAVWQTEADRYREALEDAAEYLRLASTWIVDTDRHDKMLAAHRRAKEALQRA